MQVGSGPTYAISAFAPHVLLPVKPQRHRSAALPLCDQAAMPSCLHADWILAVPHVHVSVVWQACGCLAQQLHACLWQRPHE